MLLVLKAAMRCPSNEESSSVYCQLGEVPLVLEAFEQVDSSLSRNQQGTGLGLPLVRAMMELHGGSFAIDSVPDQGTTVRLVFPPVAP